MEFEEIIWEKHVEKTDVFQVKYCQNFFITLKHKKKFIFIKKLKMFGKIFGCDLGRELVYALHPNASVTHIIKPMITENVIQGSNKVIL